MAIIQWREERVKYIPVIAQQGVTEDLSGKEAVILVPGWNQIHDGDWNNCRRFVLDLIKAKTIVEKGVIQEAKEGVLEKLGKQSFKTLKVEEALETIKGTANLDTLKTWLDTDTREEIRLTLTKRIELVQKTQPNKEAPDKVKLEKLW